jgi:hypothetical protein
VAVGSTGHVQTGSERDTRLRVFQAMWGMEGLDDAHGTTPEARVETIAAAGFDGVGVSCGDADFARTVASAAAGHGLGWIAICFPRDINEFEDTLALVHDIGVDRLDHVNLQPDVRPFTPLECVPYLLRWQALADEAGVRLHFENHRGRMTTDLRFTLQLLDALPDIRLTADLSHFVVGQEFRWPIGDEDNHLIERILARTWAYHGRVASREQVQLQISFAHHEPWLRLFLNWWEQGFRLWREVAPADATLTFMTELGPPGWYAMTGPDGEELSDRWAEALQLRSMVVDRWRLVCAEQ